MTDRSIDELDDKIREALRREDAELLKHFRSDPPLVDMMIETFRGRHVWLNTLGFLFTFIAFGLTLFCAYQFFHAEGTRAMIAWASGFLWSALSVAMLKIWFWMEMHRYSLIREIKRLELQVAHLSRQIGSEN
jgi:hypothetical protein